MAMTMPWRRSRDWTKDLLPLIRATIGRLGGVRSAKKIVAEMTFGDDWRAIKGNPTMLRALAAEGLNKEVRDFLGRGDPDDDADDDIGGGVPQEQLDLWPIGAHSDLVRSIGKVAVFVPSRQAHIKVEPEDISPSECIEAGRFLHIQSEEMRLRGDRLIELGELGGWDSSKDDDEGGEDE